MAKSIVIQKRLDKAKWLESERLHTDLSGNMDYCDFCDQQANFRCRATQLDREMNCLCAKAWNKKTRKGGEEMSGRIRPIRSLKPCKCGCTDINVQQEYDVLTRTYFCLVGCMDINCEEHIIAESKISYIEARNSAINSWNRRATNETD